ncbi:hypothetical protein COCVIDRAFT_14257 [Bipolaris victoriae FI3]|uniref:Uncharacterized protein n=1 Tax=Bipolaris victoriae (strain FI3) TaxID=930091 RepID=W7EYL7_BIPV3|nr:hypothetical protein COCVIDRAFT_14257 [Bipolaris victoriae FI3]
MAPRGPIALPRLGSAAVAIVLKPGVPRAPPRVLKRESSRSTTVICCTISVLKGSLAVSLINWVPPIATPPSHPCSTSTVPVAPNRLTLLHLTIERDLIAIKELTTAYPAAKDCLTLQNDALT